MKNIAKGQRGNCVIAIVGGSGSGKTWLTNQLMAQMHDLATHLSLDDFYRDRSNLPAKRREKLNFDSPSAIDWRTLMSTILRYRNGESALDIPRYDFTTHQRLPAGSTLNAKPVLIVEGLWLLHRENLRGLFDLKIFVDCPNDLRFCRRMERDVLERGRTADSVTEQFRATVLPMHERHVQPQARWADELIYSPPTNEDVLRLVKKVKARAEESAAKNFSAVH